jgi:hypothetical protein
LDPKTLRSTVDQFHKSKKASSRKQLTSTAHKLAKASTVTDDELTEIEAKLQSSGMTWDELAEMVGVINQMDAIRRQLSQAVDPTPEYDSARYNLDSILAQSEDLKLADHQSRQRWKCRRDEAQLAVQNAHSKIRQLEMVKANLARLEREHADLLEVA